MKYPRPGACRCHWSICRRRRDRQSATEDGIDLEGTVVNRGVTLGAGSASLADRWYSGYFRVATNEKGVVRSYLSTGDAVFGRQLERRTRTLLQQKSAGHVID